MPSLRSGGIGSSARDRDNGDFPIRNTGLWRLHNAAKNMEIARFELPHTGSYIAIQCTAAALGRTRQIGAANQEGGKLEPFAEFRNQLLGVRSAIAGAMQQKPMAICESADLAVGVEGPDRNGFQIAPLFDQC